MDDLADDDLCGCGSDVKTQQMYGEIEHQAGEVQVRGANEGTEVSVCVQGVGEQGEDWGQHTHKHITQTNTDKRTHTQERT